MRVERVRTPWFEVRDEATMQTPARIVTLDASPPPGQALGLAVHGGVTYYYMDLRVDPTEDDGRRWAALHQQR